jgi:hypothetical protein
LYFTGGIACPEMVIRCPERSTSPHVLPTSIGTAHDRGIRQDPCHSMAAKRAKQSGDSLSGPVGVYRPFLHRDASTFLSAVGESASFVRCCWRSNLSPKW